jgi:hypothetical protein
MKISRPVMAALAMITLAATAAAQEPRWMLVSESPEGYYDIDTRNIELAEVEGHVRMWNRLRYFGTQEEYGIQFDTEVSLMEYDCATGRMRMLSLIGFLGDHRVFTGIAKPESWGDFEQPGPNTIGENMTSLACQYMERMQTPLEDLDTSPELVPEAPTPERAGQPDGSGE